MGADARVESYTFDDGTCVQAFHLGIGVELVEVAHTQGKVGVGEELDGLGLLHSHEERVDVWLEGSFLQKCGKGVGSLLHSANIGNLLDGFIFLEEGGSVDNLGITHDDATGIEVVIEGFALAEELG